MYKIVRKESLNPTVTLMEIEAPLVARKAEPGQFIIFRATEDGERIPLTIAGYDREKGTVTIIFQIVGAGTEILNSLNVGEGVHDFADAAVSHDVRYADTRVVCVQLRGILHRCKRAHTKLEQIVCHTELYARHKLFCCFVVKLFVKRFGRNISCAGRDSWIRKRFPVNLAV